jgi:hypothetical protein
MLATFTFAQEEGLCPLWVKSRHLRCNKPCPVYANSDRKSEFPQTVMSVFPPKADMCGAAIDVRFGPIADSCTAAIDAGDYRYPG